MDCERFLLLWLCLKDIAEWKESKLAIDLEDIGDGVISISDTPEGVKGVQESVECRDPSERRMAMRMSSPPRSSAIFSPAWRFHNAQDNHHNQDSMVIFRGCVYFCRSTWTGGGGHGG